MSRFDDEIRAASRQLAREPMPDAMLDESLESVSGPRRAAWFAGAGIIAFGLALAISWLVGRASLPVATGESSSAEPSASAIVGECHDLPRIGAYSFEYRVFFPCADGSGLVSTPRVMGIPVRPVEPLESAIRDLLSGPNAQETAAGMTAVAAPDSGSLLTAVHLQPDGLAIVDLSPDAASAGLGPVFLDAVKATALDQAAVTAVELRLAGDCEDFFALVGAVCDHLAEPVELATECPVIAPEGLPEGDIVMMGTTAGRPHPVERNVVSWGAGENTVTEQIGSPGGEPYAIDGDTMRLPSLNGDSTMDGAELVWVKDGCPYRVTMQGRGWAFAVDYSNLFASGPAVQPSLPPLGEAPYGSASVEADGIRISLALDRTETSFGERVWAEVTVENVGSEVVHWGHSGTCGWPARIALITDAVPPAYGMVWPGETGILKRITVDDPDIWLLGFVPEFAIDLQTDWGCTSDLVMDEIPPGERRSARFAWETVGMNGMPPAEGRYVAESVFSYQGRGDVDPNADPFRHQVRVQVSLDVHGPAQGYLSPGEAMDLLLADETFIRLLAENPHTQWNSSTLRWGDETWQLEIAQEGQHGSVVATVDAITGVVSNVEVRPR